MELINIYKNNPTAGQTDGTLVSTGGAQTSPIETGELDAAINEQTDPIKLAIRCETGYQTTGETTITPVTATAERWQLAPDNGGQPGTWLDWGDSLVIPGVIGDTNTIFWARVRAVDTENPINDRSTSLRIETVVEEG